MTQPIVTRPPFNITPTSSFPSISWRVAGIGIASLILALGFAAKTAGLFNREVLERKPPILQKISQLFNNLFVTSSCKKNHELKVEIPVPAVIISLPNPTELSNHQALVSHDTLGWILSFLPLSDFLSAAFVCKNWAEVIRKPDLWKNPLSYKSTNYRLIEEFLPYVDKNKLSWKEACRFSELAVLLNRILEIKFPGLDAYITAENPDLINVQNPYTIMRQARISYGNTVLSIFNSSDIKVQVKGDPLFRVLRGEQGTILTQLAVENEFVFALRLDGIIVQINLETEEQKTIPTSWALNQVPKTDPFFESWSPFLVKNGYIVVHYGSFTTQTVLEVIPYKNPDLRQVQLDPQLDKFRRFAIKQGRVYLGGLRIGHIFSMSLTPPKQVKVFKLDSILSFTDDHDVRDLAVFDHFLCVSDLQGLYLIDTKTGKCIKRPGLNFSQIVVIENLLFGAVFKASQNGESTSAIVVHDLNTGDTIATIPGILNPQSTEILPEVLPRLVQICREHCKKFIPPESLTKPTFFEWLWSLLKAVSFWKEIV